jgi:hypothetical protein
LVFFKEGIKQFIYDGEHGVGDIAEAIAKFTGDLPSSYPIQRRLAPLVGLSTQFMTNYEMKLDNPSDGAHVAIPWHDHLLYWIHKKVNLVIRYLSNSFGWHRLKQLRNQACLEPIAGTFSFACEHDIVIFAVTALYVILRWIYTIRSFLKSRVHEEEGGVA